MAMMPGARRATNSGGTSPALCVRRSHTRFCTEHRFARAEWIGPQRPGDLHVARLVECRELVGRQPRNVTFASQGRVTAPITTSRPGTSASARQPSDFVSASTPCGRAAASGSTAKDHFACPENTLRAIGRLLKVRLTRGREGDLRRRGHANVVTLCDVVGRHEPVEERVLVLGSRRRRLAITQPCDAGICCVRGSSDAGAHGQPPSRGTRLRRSSSSYGHPPVFRRDNAQLLPETEAVFRRIGLRGGDRAAEVCSGCCGTFRAMAWWERRGRDGEGEADGGAGGSERGLSVIARGLDGRKEQPVGQPGQNLRMNHLVLAGQRPATGQLPPVHAGLIHDDPEGIPGDEAH